MQQAVTGLVSERRICTCVQQYFDNNRLRSLYRQHQRIFTIAVCSIDVDTMLKQQANTLSVVARHEVIQGIAMIVIAGIYRESLPQQLFQFLAITAQCGPVPLLRHCPGQNLHRPHLDGLGGFFELRPGSPVSQFSCALYPNTGLVGLVCGQKHTKRILGVRFIVASGQFEYTFMGTATKPPAASQRFASVRW